MNFKRTGDTIHFEQNGTVEICDITGFGFQLNLQKKMAVITVILKIGKNGPYFDFDPNDRYQFIRDKTHQMSIPDHIWAEEIGVKTEVIPAEPTRGIYRSGRIYTPAYVKVRVTGTAPSKKHPGRLLVFFRPVETVPDFGDFLGGKLKEGQAFLAAKKAALEAETREEMREKADLRGRFDQQIAIHREISEWMIKTFGYVVAKIDNQWLSCTGSHWLGHTSLKGDVTTADTSAINRYYGFTNQEADEIWAEARDAQELIQMMLM
jgi:hypothetical protein